MNIKNHYAQAAALTPLPNRDQICPVSPLIPAAHGQPPELGSHFCPTGTCFAVFASHATYVELCLFAGPEPKAKETRYRLRQGTDGVWYGHLEGIQPGQLYGYRVWGPWDPSTGKYHNPYKLLLDPYARAIHGEVDYCAQVHAHKVDEQLYTYHGDMVMDTHNSAPFTARSVVAASPFPVAPHPQTPWNRTVIYEAHVRGFTKNLPGVPEDLRGTYAGLAHPVTVDYLKDLGVTAVELLPIHASMSEPFLQERGLSNYWGYNTLSYFAPEPRYATARARAAGPLAVLDEVRGMVSLLHQAGLEVILDVVYNHTCEGGIGGTCLSWRGLDSAAYYLTGQGSPPGFIDTTGCGNSLDFGHTRVVQMTLDSLRYWVEEVGIDGFRFDLAVTLGRANAVFSPRHPLFVAIATDPVLKNVKMISEPWDLGLDGWKTGHFPAPFADWNDRFRDTVRSFWLADPAALSKGHRPSGPHRLATRLAGSSDLFRTGEYPCGRGPQASINYVTAHDGFTLSDLASYNHKHNENNLEENRDGTNNNLSWNHGIEGHVMRMGTGYSPQDQRNFDAMAAEIAPLRMRSIRNLMGTLLISAGTPMLVAGDEFARTQDGNNNAYCQDNEISWVDWDLMPFQRELHATARHLLQLRASHPVLRPSQFAVGKIVPGDTLPDLSWYDAEGQPMTGWKWHDEGNRVFQMLRSGLPYDDDDALIVFNGSLDTVPVTPPLARHNVFRLVWDSTWDSPEDAEISDEPATETGGLPVSQNVLVGLPGVPADMEVLSMRIYLASSQESDSLLPGFLKHQANH